MNGIPADFLVVYFLFEVCYNASGRLGSWGWIFILVHIGSKCSMKRKNVAAQGLCKQGNTQNCKEETEDVD